MTFDEFKQYDLLKALSPKLSDFLILICMNFPQAYLLIKPDSDIDRLYLFFVTSAVYLFFYVFTVYWRAYKVIGHQKKLIDDAQAELKSVKDNREAIIGDWSQHKEHIFVLMNRWDAIGIGIRMLNVKPTKAHANRLQEEYIKLESGGGING